MRSVYLLLAGSVALASAVPAAGQDAPPPPPIATAEEEASSAPGPGPAGPDYRPGSRPLMIGPKDSTGFARTIRGKVAATGNPPAGVTPASVELFADDKLIGSAAKRPFGVEYDTAQLSDGEHVFKAVGKDASGQRIWAAVTNVRVQNSGRAVPPPTLNTTGPRPDDSRPGAEVKPSPVPGGAGVVALEQSYTSAQYGITIRHPAGWVVKDETAHMKPKTPGGFWLVFSTDPVEKAKIVVNLRRMALEPTTTADVFARYNKYVLKWQRKTVLGSSAFATSVGTAQARRVTHRLIIIKDGSAWMLNCIDTSGGPADESMRLFESMVETLQTQPG